MYKFFTFIVILSILINSNLAIWCYECVSNQPGCGTPFNWLWHWTRVCPEDDDICVKILEQKDGETVITRSCLSSVKGIRTDIPADHYEGCRPAAVDLHLANYVNNTVKELDIYRYKLFNDQVRENYYDNTTWCFCFLDHRCNSGATFKPPLLFGVLAVIISIYLW